MYFFVVIIVDVVEACFVQIVVTNMYRYPFLCSFHPHFFRCSWTLILRCPTDVVQVVFSSSANSLNDVNNVVNNNVWQL